MLLAGLSLLATVAAVSSGLTYQLLENYPRAATALLERPSPSALWCAAFCRRRPDCTHWLRDSASSVCSLYPAASSAEATTISGATLFAPIMPPGYVPLSPGRAIKMFRIHVDETITNGLDIKTACALDGSGVVPAFPNDDEQMDFLKAAIAETGVDFFWVGIREQRPPADGVYGNFIGTRRLTMKPEWITQHQAESTFNYYCVWMEKTGIESQDCGAEKGYICQYERY